MEASFREFNQDKVFWLRAGKWRLHGDGVIAALSHMGFTHPDPCGTQTHTTLGCCMGWTPVTPPQATGGWTCAVSLCPPILLQVELDPEGCALCYSPPSLPVGGSLGAADLCAEKLSTQWKVILQRSVRN